MKADWTLKELVDPDTGKVSRLYWYKGKICKRIVLESQMAKQLAGYVLIEKDLRSAEVWLLEISKIRGHDVLLDIKGSRHSKDRERYNLVKGLFVAALTFYGKSFATCDGRRVKLERRQITSEYQEMHDEAISFRNNFAAHSGSHLLESATIALALPPRNKRDVQPQIFREMTQPDYFMEKKGNKSFTELVQHAREIPLRKITQLNEKILQEEVLAKGYAHWKKI